MAVKFLMSVLLGCCFFQALGQRLDTMSELNRFASSLKAATNMTYHYAMRAVYPNKETDQVTGDLYLDNSKKQFYNDCDAFTLLFNPHCYYRADHRKKTVDVLNLEKSVNKKYRKGIEKEVFQSGAMITFLDSLLMKKSKVSLLSKEADILDFRLSFPKGQAIQTMEVLFDCATNLPVRIEMDLFQQTQNKPLSGPTTGISTHMKCEKFRRVTEMDIPDESSLYEIKKGNIELVRYTNYKLSAQK